MGLVLMIHIVTHVNPEPWAVGKAYAARTKTGAVRGGISPNKKVQSYQRALKDELKDLPGIKMHEPGEHGLVLRLWFWRQIEVASRGERKSSGHIADVTNLQKSTEDALQGILFENDSSIRFVVSEIVEQEVSTIPTIAIEVWRYPPSNPMEIFTDHVCNMRTNILASLLEEEEKSYRARNSW